MAFFLGAPWYNDMLIKRCVSLFPINFTTRLLWIFTTLIPNSVGYKIKFPDSSNTIFQDTCLEHEDCRSWDTFDNIDLLTLTVADCPPWMLPISFSVASRLPNSISSSVNTAVPACCISVIVVMDSSYFRRSLPDLNEKMRICRSPNPKVANLSYCGENWSVVGATLACHSVDFVSI